MRRHHPVIVGEWSLALDSKSLSDTPENDHNLAYKAYGDAQLLAYGQASAWFYWSYNTESGGVWSFRDCVEKGLLTVPRLT